MVSSKKLDCCDETGTPSTSSTTTGIANARKIAHGKRDRNPLTDSPATRSLQSSDESIVTSSTCEADEKECYPSCGSSTTGSSYEDSDKETVKCDSRLNFEGTLENGEVIQVIDSKKNQNVCTSLQNSDPQENHKRTNVIVQYFKKKSQGWNRKQFVIILILSFVEFFASAVVSIQAPFYPDIARQKGATATEYGLVFGIFEATVFIISPFYGAKMGSLGPTRVFNWGIFVTGVCCIIFGLLDRIEGRVPFILSCLIVRVVEAMGDAAFETASFTIIAVAFPQSVATSFAMLEISYGLGLIIGPTLGGALYQLGGYSLPFLVMGSLLFASALATYLFLPDPGLKENVKSTENAAESSPPATTEEETPPPVVLGGFQMFRMLKIPVIAMTAYSIVAATTGVGMLSGNLEHHLEQFQLNKLAVGSVFILNGGVYAVTAPAWGWICDHTENQKKITLAGAIFTILGFIFIGPVPYFPSDTTLPMSCVGLALFGLGLAAILVSAFLQVLKDAIAHGYPDDISTYGLVSGLWTCMSALGYFIGPFVGGILDDWVGFRWSTVFVIAGMVVLLILLAGFHISHFRRNSTSSNFSRNRVEVQLEEDLKNHNSIKKSITTSDGFSNAVVAVHENDASEIFANANAKTVNHRINSQSQIIST
ncbi:unnamed protein product [Orchesella dallaii]|uniref:Major facilitator superfamily (MFS) profile domain-containing protein n=1 Tax=Orchesella dallaii TaxID=48710 RepID=A0ABP1S3I0_9HEXA